MAFNLFEANAMPWWTIAIVAHGAVTWFLVGLIWIVQRVHYPSMHYAEPDRFIAFEKMHCDRIGQIVAPIMILEGAIAAGLLFLAPNSITLGLSVVGSVLAAINWWSTFFIQVPLHNHLQHGKNPDTIDRLIATNWIRTIAWSARGGIAAGLFFGS
jgi:hypothetical protein